MTWPFGYYNNINDVNYATFDYIAVSICSGVIIGVG